MKNTFLASEFFLSSNTTEGFFSFFDHLYYPEKNWFCYIIKGGPGTGKSTLMKKISDKAIKKNILTEIIHCSSDPNSLDAVIFPELKIAIADGTSPHIIEPIYPGITDKIINLGECWNSKNLYKHKSEIIKLCKKNSIYHQKSKKYLKAYGIIFNEIKNIIFEAIEYESISNYCQKISKKLFKKVNKNIQNKGSEQVKFLSAITPLGYVTFDNTIINLSEKIFILEDTYKTVGNYIIKNIKETALKSGYNVIACPSPMFPSTEFEALIIPELNISFVVKDKKEVSQMSNINNLNYKKISTKKFLKSEIINQNKNLILFNQKICKEFLNESIKNLKNALLVHDDIENIYKESMNYSKINKITDKLISAIL